MAATPCPANNSDKRPSSWKSNPPPPPPAPLLPRRSRRAANTPNPFVPVNLVAASTRDCSARVPKSLARTCGTPKHNRARTSPSASLVIVKVIVPGLVPWPSALLRTTAACERRESRKWGLWDVKLHRPDECRSCLPFVRVLASSQSTSALAY